MCVRYSLRYEQPVPARLNASRPPGWRRTPRLRWRTPRAEAPRVKSAPRPRSCGPRPAETSIVGSGSGTSPRCISRLGGATRASSALCATPARRSPRATARADGPRCTAPSTTGTRAPPPRSSRAARASTPRSTGWADPRWTSSPERSADASTTTPSTVRVRIDRPRPRPARRRRRLRLRVVVVVVPTVRSVLVGQRRQLSARHGRCERATDAATRRRRRRGGPNLARIRGWGRRRRRRLRVGRVRGYESSQEGTVRRRRLRIRR